jgi:hypothetical protein
MDDKFPEAPPGVSPWLVWLVSIGRWLAPRLVDDAGKFWRWLSVELAAVDAAMPLLREYVPAFKVLIPETAYHWATAALGVLIIIARVTRQGEPKQ